MTGQIVATTTAISLNFILNNFFTYRDNRLSGWTMTRGLLFFYLTCSLGAFANSCVASYLFENQIQWWLAGLLGAIIGGVWNYAVSSVIVWPMKKFSAGNESHIPIQWQELPNNLKG
jgi:dolichol-phosphate mannosyltransferase